MIYKQNTERYGKRKGYNDTVIMNMGVWPSNSPTKMVINIGFGQKYISARIVIANINNPL